MIIVILLLIGNSYAGDGQFECGPNGRFEYCIDDNPGCVVGCHCYPGYYFDTDTKICEPNTKLTQDFRRHYIIDAGRQTTTTEPAPTQPNAKENDDLSDWLYNQFFKTIENQVVNETNNGKLIKKGTRRSGSRVSDRKLMKKKRRTGSKKKTRQELRRKLLRISEDDSMFDSRSDSRSESEGSSSSSSWESWGPPDEPDEHKHKHDDSEHGHRKIVIYSKKPKPPLPSFIFLPNIETPFYPPIGLPMPPLPAPMYPMIPVPPIRPPPQGGTIPPTPKDTATAATTSAVTGDTTTTKATSKHEAPAPPSSDSPPHSSSATTAPTDDNSNGEDNDKLAAKPDSMKRSGQSKMSRSQARNLLQRLKDRNKSQRKRKETKGNMLKQVEMNNLMDQFKVPSIASGDLFQQPILEDNTNHEENKLLPFENDVDFKYLTQLIHRVDNGTTPSSLKMQLNNNGNVMVSPMKPPAPASRPGPLPPPAPARRNFNARVTPTDDSYYTNLGREIAQLIRDIHPDEIDEISIDVEQGDNGKASPYFGQNSFASRSYWERSVRSPIRMQLGRFSKYENSKSSSERLFDLESKVEVAANSSPILSLPELENIINAMEMAKNKIHSHRTEEKSKTPSINSSLNVSLLPRPRENLSNGHNKPSNLLIKTHAAERSRSNQHDFRRNNLNSARVKASDRIQANHTNNIERMITQHDHSKLGYNIQFASPNEPNNNIIHNWQSNIKKNTIPPSPKYQLRSAINPHDNMKRYFSNTDNKMYPYFPNILTGSYKSYKESKPSYFFTNEFNYFI